MWQTNEFSLSLFLILKGPAAKYRGPLLLKGSLLKVNASVNSVVQGEHCFLFHKVP